MKVCLFVGTVPGAESAVTGIVTLLSVAHTLTQANINQEIKDANKNVYFLLLDGVSLPQFHN